MNHGLLVAAQIVRKVRILLQRLADAGYVAVAKNSEATRKEGKLDPVPLDILIFQKCNCGLRRRQSTR